jgi:hypothetical protein
MGKKKKKKKASQWSEHFKENKAIKKEDESLVQTKLTVVSNLTYYVQKRL